MNEAEKLFHLLLVSMKQKKHVKLQYRTYNKHSYLYKMIRK